jgi:hypothetical protein
MSINHRLLTAFHPQTDGHTVRHNQTIELCGQAFYNYQHNIWPGILARAEFE